MSYIRSFITSSIFLLQNMTVSSKMMVRLAFLSCSLSTGRLSPLAPKEGVLPPGDGTEMAVLGHVHHEQRGVPCTAVMTACWPLIDSPVRGRVSIKVQ